ELQLAYARHVVRDRDRTGDGREVEVLAALDIGRVGGAVRRVGPGEVDDLVGEVLSALAGASFGVVDGDVGVLLLEGPDHRFVVRMLERRPCAVQRGRPALGRSTDCTRDRSAQRNLADDQGRGYQP